MIRLLWALTALALGLQPASAQVVINTNPTTLAPYQGTVATRVLAPNFVNTGANSANANSLHIARDRITTLQVAYANWYANSTVHEAAGPGPLTYAAKIQYPIGAAWQTFTWSGAATSPTISAGSTGTLSDALVLATPIPNGAAFLIHTYETGANGVIIQYFSTNDHRTAFDAVQVGNGVADSTTVASPVAGSLLTPIRIVATTTKPSVFLLGDSRCFGQGDIPDGAGDVGEIARTIGPVFAYGKFCVPGEQAQYWIANNSRRLALLSDYSHVVGNFGINDLRTGARTAAQLLADIATSVAQVGTKPIFWDTIYPGPTSTDNWVTLANQTASSESANVVTVNRALRGGQVVGLTGVFDVAAAIESGPESGKYQIGNGGQGIASDALHMNTLGYKAVKNSRAIDTAQIVLTQAPR